MDEAKRVQPLNSPLGMSSRVATSGPGDEAVSLHGFLLTVVRPFDVAKL